MPCSYDAVPMSADCQTLHCAPTLQLLVIDWFNLLHTLRFMLLLLIHCSAKQHYAELVLKHMCPDSMRNSNTGWCQGHNCASIACCAVCLLIPFPLFFMASFCAWHAQSWWHRCCSLPCLALVKSCSVTELGTMQCHHCNTTCMRMFLCMNLTGGNVSWDKLRWVFRFKIRRATPLACNPAGLCTSNASSEGYDQR